MDSHKSMAETLSSLHAGKNWSDIITFYSEYCENSNSASPHFFAADAYIRLEKWRNADLLVKKGLSLNATNSWGRHLKYDLDKMLVSTEFAQDELYNYLVSYGTHKTLAATFINSAVCMKDFQRAAEINLMRDVIVDGLKKARYALALQTFCKADTLKQVLESLLKLKDSEQFSLYILQDTPAENHSAKYTEGFQDVQQVLAAYLSKLQLVFESVHVYTNTKNMGTAPSCKKLLDRVIEVTDGFMFIEDDCILSSDALKFAKTMLENKISENGKYWFASCESTFFNNKEGNEIDIDKVKRDIEQRSLNQKLYTMSFVPSTCFITSREIWLQCSNFRSFPRGPESLTAYIKDISKLTIAPVVPRARDIGMLHDLGYSVMNLGKDGVKEVKEHFLDSDLFEETKNYQF